MLKRKSPRNIPNRSHYVRLDVEGRGETVWRIPSFSRILPLLQLASTNEALAGLNEAIQEGRSIEAGTRLKDFFVLQGAVLGTCWADPYFDLETSRRDFEKGENGLLDYGEEVYEELYEGGWNQTEVNEVTAKLFPMLTAHLIDEKKVKERADFLKPTAEQLTSPI